MSEVTSTSVVVAPSNQVDTLQRITVPAQVRRVLEGLNREAVVKAELDGKVAEYAGDIAGAFRFLKSTGDRVEAGKTITAAYVYRLLGPDGAKQSMGDIAEVLGVGNSSVTRYRYIARLHFDLGFGPEDGPMWSVMANQLVSKSEFVKILKDPNVTSAQIVDAYNRLTAPKPAVTATVADDSVGGASVGGSESEGSDGVETVSRGANGTRESKLVVPASNSLRLEYIETLIAALDTLSPQEFARLSGIHGRIETVLNGADAKVKSAGRKLAAKAGE